MLVDHNVPNLLRSVGKVQKAIRKMDCAVAEMKFFADILAPHAKKEKRK